MKFIENGKYVDLPHYRQLPVYLIFDEALRTSGNIATMWLSWPITTQGYKWSKDNAKEIENGWILKADTIEELAQKMGYAPETIAETVARYNGMVDAGADTDYSRAPETMARIETGPFYAIGITPTLVATTGGAKRDTAGRVLDWNDEPIPGLSEAGELGSYISNLYQNGCFLSEVMLSGRAAAQTAMGGASTFEKVEKVSAAEPWTGKADGMYAATIKGMHDQVEVTFTVKDGKLAGNIKKLKNQGFQLEEIQQVYDGIFQAGMLELMANKWREMDWQVRLNGMILARMGECTALVRRRERTGGAPALVHQRPFYMRLYPSIAALWERVNRNAQ